MPYGESCSSHVPHGTAAVAASTWDPLSTVAPRVCLATTSRTWQPVGKVCMQGDGDWRLRSERVLAHLGNTCYGGLQRAQAHSRTPLSSLQIPSPKATGMRHVLMLASTTSTVPLR